MRTEIYGIILLLCSGGICYFGGTWAISYRIEKEIETSRQREILLYNEVKLLESHIDAVFTLEEKRNKDLQYQIDVLTELQRASGANPTIPNKVSAIGTN